MENKQFKDTCQDETFGTIEKIISPAEVKVEVDFHCANQLESQPPCEEEHFKKCTIKNDNSSLCEWINIETSHLTNIKEETDDDTDNTLVYNIVKNEFISEEYDIPFKHEDDVPVCEEEAHSRNKQIKEQCVTDETKSNDLLCDGGLSSSTSSTVHEVSDSSNNKQYIFLKAEYVKCNRCSAYFRGKNCACEKNKVPPALISYEFQCDICLKVYKTESTLKRHTRVHNVKPLKCEICSKELWNRFSAEKHALIHIDIGMKPFKCETCLTFFMNRSDYKNHILNHSCKKKRFKCEFCSKEYTDKCYCKCKCHICLKKVNLKDVDVDKATNHGEQY